MQNGGRNLRRVLMGLRGRWGGRGLKKTVGRARGDSLQLSAISFFASRSFAAGHLLPVWPNSDGQLTTTVMGSGLALSAGSIIRKRWPSGEGK
jgi:hypothetical protein